MTVAPRGNSALLLVAVVLVIAAIASFGFAGVVLLADSSDNGGNTLRGTLTLTDDIERRVSGGEASILTTDDECFGTRGYDDIRAGASVVVKNEEGKIIATGNLGQGIDELGLGYSCVFQITVDDVTDADFYSIAVSNRGELTYSRQELEGRDWEVSFSLGD